MGVLFTAIEGLKTMNYITETPKCIDLISVGILFALVTAVVFVYLAVKTMYQTCNHTHSIPGTGLTVATKVGDVLKQRKGRILIGVNDELEHDLHKVGENSLQGKLIKQHGQDWMKQVMEDYKKEHPLPEGEKTYPMGTIVPAKDPDRKYEYLFLVMAHLVGDGIPDTTERNVKTALDKLFSGNNDFRCKNNRLYAPLVGTGQTALTTDRRRFAQLMAFEFIRQKSESMPVHHLVITYRRKNISRMRPQELYAELAAMTTHCRECWAENWK